MIPLLKIRIKYAKTHLISFIIYYIIIPLFLFIFSLSIKKAEKPEIYPKTNSYINGEYYLFPEEKENYKNIIYFFDEISIISKDKNECKKFAEFLKKEANQTVYPMEKKEFKCYNNEKELPYGEDAIVIIKKNEKYEFQFLMHNTFILFDYKLLSTESSIDIFNVEKLQYANETKNSNRYLIYLQLQSLIARYLIQNKEGKIPYEKQKNMKITLGANSYPEYTSAYKTFGQITRNRKLLIYLFIFSFTLSLYSYFINIRMIEEKEQQLDLFIKRYGISDIKYIFSWLIPFIFINLLIIIDFCILYYKIVPYHLLLFIINIILYDLSLFSVSHFFYSCFSSTKTGNSVIKFYNLGLPALGCAIILDFVPKSTKFILALIPQVNIFHCTYAIIALQTFKNLSWNKLFLKANKISYIESIIIYIIDIIFYLFLSILIEKYKIFSFNIMNYFKKFFIYKSFNITNDNNIVNEEEDNDSDKLLFPKENNHQELSLQNKIRKSQNKSLKISELNFKYEKKNILNNFNAEFFKGEIYCIIGQSGEGKSSLINIISGISNPNHGDIIYNGRSLIKDKSYLYENISLCQQQNIFFNFLTVKEHLEIMKEIKSRGINYAEINNLLKEFDLFDKRDSPCNILSEGQKRKLCVILALIDDSSIILFDEPTMGMDVESKKKFWDIMKNRKEDKIIIITTNSLPEAEYLADRIGIIFNGNLICSGSSSYLKEKYSCGFTINIFLNIKNEKYEENRQKLISKINNLEQKLEIKYLFKGIISINIKSENKNILKLFKCIEDSQEELGIEDYTFHSTSLEDIFLKANNYNNIINSERLNENKNSENENPIFNNKIKNNDFNCMFKLYYQLKRNIILLRRNILIFFIELILGIFASNILFLLYFKKWNLQSINAMKNLDLISILESNVNYVCDKNNYLKKSYVYELSNSIPFKYIEKEPNNISEFMENIYQNSFDNIAKGSIYIKKIETNENIYEAYNTEIFTGYYGNLYANTMLLVSSFLKNEYNIDASILTKIKYNFVGTSKMKVKQGFGLAIICVCFLFGFILFLIGLASQKFNERKNKIKQLICLNGGDLKNYWTSFLILDFIKLMVFSSLLLISTGTINNSGNYIWINMIFVSISSLFFIYFISYFCSKEDSIIKFIIIFLLIICGMEFIFKNKKIQKNFPNLIIENFCFSAFDLNPITSMGLSTIRLIYHYCSEPTDLSKSEFRPITIALLNSFIVQLFNILLYGSLFVLTELGYFKKFSHLLKKYIILKEKNQNYEEKYLKEIIPNKIENLSILEKRTDDNINIEMTNYDFGDEEAEVLDKNEESKEYYLDSNNINRIEIINNNLYKIPHSTPNVLNEVNNIKNKKYYLTKIENLKKTFKINCRQKIFEINNLYLGLKTNEKFGLFGPNGSGKSVIFKMITKEFLHEGGEIVLLNSLIGFCPQEIINFESMKVKEIIQFFLGLKSNSECFEGVVKKYGLHKYLYNFFSNLSFGNKRKLLVVLALINEPYLILLDEPFQGMDIISKRNILNNILSTTSKSRRYNLILSTHCIDEAALLCDRVSLINKGNFIFIGDKKEFLSSTTNKYKLYIKFDKSKTKIKEISKKSFELLINSVKNFKNYSDYLFGKPELGYQIEILVKIINNIKSDTHNLELNKIENNNYYDFDFQIIKDHRNSLFLKIVELKKDFPQIEEIRVGKESLEKFLMNFK